MKDLFGNEIPGQPIGKKANSSAIKEHLKLLNIYGEVEDRCKNCSHFIIKSYSKTYFKCEIAGHVDSSGPAYDWRANWKACGKFTKSETPS